VRGAQRPTAGAASLARDFPALERMARAIAERPLPDEGEAPVRSDDFTDISASRAEALGNYERALRLIKVKDSMIWTLIESRRRLDAEASAALDDAVARAEERCAASLARVSEECAGEVARWKALAESAVARAAEADLGCFYCGARLHSSIVNGDCFRNTDVVGRGGAQGGMMMAEAPPPSHHGTLRHFFIRDTLADAGVQTAGSLTPRMMMG
jgi:hypothetical protein